MEAATKFEAAAETQKRNREAAQVNKFQVTPKPIKEL